MIMTFQSSLHDEANFSYWAAWQDRRQLQNLHFPGVYILAISQTQLSGKAFSWIEEIAYVGMTNSVNGLLGRLRQFDNTILGKQGHGGAERFCNDYHKPEDLFPLLYVAVFSFPCEVTALTSRDLRIMGDVAKAEYECFARYVNDFGRMPRYNDKAISPKPKKQQR